MSACHITVVGVISEVKAEGEEVAEKEETEQKEEEAKPEEKPVFTLSEYEEMMKDKNVLLLAPTKKETPMVDKAQFDGMAVLKKSPAESGFEGLEVEKIRKRKEKREKEVETVEVAFRVGEPIRRGRGRGRGRSRDFESDGMAPKWTNGAGPPPDLPRTDSGGTYPRSPSDLCRYDVTVVDRRGRGGRGRGYRGRGDGYGRGGGRQNIDMASENVFPSLSG